LLSCRVRGCVDRYVFRGQFSEAAIFTIGDSRAIATCGGGWADSSAGSFPDWLQIDFNGSKTISEVDVFTLQDSYSSPSEPTETMTFSTYGLTAYDVQYWNGSTWVTITGGNITGNNKVWRKISFSPVTTTKIKVLTNAAVDNGYSRITEMEAWGLDATTTSTSNINWLVTDQLGTPRMIFDKTGSLATTKRHDYLPFGEEIAGARSTAQGYSVADGVRQKFTQYERDNETGLDYFLARYYASTQGRFTGVDPYDINLERQEMSDEKEAADLFAEYISQPQHWNRYAYALNNPLMYIDPDGRKDYKYDFYIFGHKVTVTISGKLDDETRAKILNNICGALVKLIDGSNGDLTPDQLKQFNKLNGIKISPDVNFTGMNKASGIFEMKPSYAMGSLDADLFAGAILHDRSFRAGTLGTWARWSATFCWR